MAEPKTPGTCPNCGATLMFEGQSICHKCGKSIADPTRLVRGTSGDVVKAAQDALAAKTPWRPEAWSSTSPASTPTSTSTSTPTSTPQPLPNAVDWFRPTEQPATTRDPWADPATGGPGSSGNAGAGKGASWREDGRVPRTQKSYGQAPNSTARATALIVGGIIAIIGIGSVVSQFSAPSYTYDWSFDPGPTYYWETPTDNTVYVWPTAAPTTEPTLEPTAAESAASPEPSVESSAVAGGSPDASATAATFPKADPLVAVGNLRNARADHTATLLADGRVVIIGGVSGAGPSTALASVEIYDPKTKKFVPGGHLVTARSGHTATLLGDGRIFVSGGRGVDGRALASAEMYDPSTGKSERLDETPTARYGASAMLTGDGKVVIVGGSDGWNPVRPANIFDPNAGVFYTIDALGELNDPSALVPLGDGRLLLIGSTMSNHPQEAVSIYRPTGNAIGSAEVEISGWGVARRQASTCLLSDGRALIVGGVDADGVDATIEVVDPGNFASVLDSSPRATMIAPRVHATLTGLKDGSALIVGGEDSAGQPIATIERWDPATGETAPVGTMARPRAGQTATLLLDGTVLIVGGRSSSTEPLASAGAYAP